MENYICITCGTQYPASEQPPAHCPICEDERQYVNRSGQQWTTLAALRTDHHNAFIELEPHLTAIVTEPKVAIGQRAHLIQTPGGNILWDCISFLDDATLEQIQQRGGLQAIAISHPHFYSSMIEWATAFNVPIYLHESNRPYVMRPDSAIQFWSGETYPLWDHITLIRCGGHFDGSTVIHWQAGAEGRGVVISGDTIYPVQDERWVTFMYSYPNMIPLPARKIEKIVAAIQPFAFERIYGAWANVITPADAKNAVLRSAERYIKAIRD